MHRPAVIDKLTKLVYDRFEGDWQRAFNFYSNNKPEMSQADLVVMLREANIGTNFSRPLIAQEIVNEAKQVTTTSLQAFVTAATPPQW